MRSPSHIIGQQFLELGFESEADAVQLQHEIGTLFRQNVLPVIEEVFDRYSPPDTYIRLDRIEIDIGRLTREALGQQFAERIREALEAQLADSNQRAPSHQAGTQVLRQSTHEHTLNLWHFALVHGFLPWWATSDTATSLEDSVLEALSARTTLPEETARLLRERDVAIRRIAALSEVALPSRILQLADSELAAVADSFMSALLQLLTLIEVETLRPEQFRPFLWHAALEEGIHRTSGEVRSRIVRVLRTALSRAARSNLETADDCVSQLRVLLHDSSTALSSTWTDGHRRILEFALTDISLGQAPQQSPNRLRNVDSESARLADIANRQNQHPSAGDQPDSAVLESTRNSAPTRRRRDSNTGRSGGDDGSKSNESGVATSELQVPPPVPGTDAPDQEHSASVRRSRAHLIDRPEVSSIRPPPDVEETSPGAASSEEREARREATPVADDTMSQRTRDDCEDETVGSDHIYVDDAGLAILHPFLATHFDRLGFLRDGEFRDENAQARAVHQLRLLAFGAACAPEANLVLAKILCGMQPDSFVEPMRPPSESVSGEAEALLAAVIDRWGALKNSTAAGLQETFLRREGKLERVDNGWRLRVDSRSFDVLLNRLPWSISLIRLPWMPGMIFVDWI